MGKAGKVQKVTEWSIPHGRSCGVSWPTSTSCTPWPAPVADTACSSSPLSSILPTCEGAPPAGIATVGAGALLPFRPWNAGAFR